MSARRPTIRDVARRAGVSVTTVSHTFSGNGKVAADTQQRVRAAAHDLGYHPDVIAQGLRNNRLGVIALVARQLDAVRPEMLHDVDYFARFAGAAAVASLAEGLGLMLVSDPTGPRAAGAALASDGFIVTEPVADDPLVAMLTGAGIPFVTVGEVPGRPTAGTEVAPHVDIGSGRLTALVLDHLWESGARRIALVTGTDRNEWNLRTIAVYERWSRHRRMAPSMVHMPESLDDGGQQAARRLLDAGPAPDGVYALTSDHALGVMSVLVERGLRVPDDVRIVAGSDAESLRSAQPAISSIDLEPEELARRAVVALIARLAGRPPADIERPVGQLVVRASSAPAAPSG